MEQKELMKRIDEIVEKGGIVADVFTHFQESDPEKLKQAAVAFATAVKSEGGVIFSLSEIAPPERDNEVYTTYVETRIVAKDMNTLAQIMMKYTPIGLEIVRPDKVMVGATDLRDSLMNVANNMYDLKNYIFKNMMSHEDRQALIKDVNEKMKKAEKLLKGDE
ncbi:MAG: hypothetical protein NTY68_01900 [Candidatus Micrarchaeota archaeon]|nr:hypothetical protein [Candidatus Micrarchaeota archaeon]